MNKFRGILICTDLDGTLLRDDKSISQENLEKIEYFKSEGGYFTFITGRMPYFVNALCDAVKPNAPFGCINGGGLYDHRSGEYIYKTELPRKALQLVEAAERGIPGIGIQINTFSRIYFSSDNGANAEFRRETGTPYIELPYREVGEPIAKVVFADEREEAILALEKLLSEHELASEFDFIRSCETLYEILPKGINKGAVLPRLSEHLKIDIRRTIAVGDYNNDIGMIEAAGVGIAVRNACENIKQIADYVTVSNEEHAIARIISDIEEGKINI